MELIHSCEAAQVTAKLCTFLGTLNLITVFAIVCHCSVL